MTGPVIGTPWRWPRALTRRPSEGGGADSLDEGGSAGMAGHRSSPPLPHSLSFASSGCVRPARFLSVAAWDQACREAAAARRVNGSVPVPLGRAGKQSVCDDGALSLRREVDRMPEGGMTVREAGRKGGETTAHTPGHEFYEEIGKKGGNAQRREGEAMRS